MKDRSSRVASASSASSSFAPDEPPTTPCTPTLGPLVRPTPPRSIKIRKITPAEVKAAQEKQEKNGAAAKPKLAIDDMPTLRPPPPPLPQTLPAPPKAESEPQFVVKAMPIIIVPPDLSAAPPLPPPPSAPPPSPSEPAEPVAVSASLTPEEETSKAPKRRWPWRVGVLVLLVGGELFFAHRTGKLEVPRDLVGARAMLGSARHAYAPAATAVNEVRGDER